MNLNSAGTPGYKTPRSVTPNDVLAQPNGARYANGYRVLDGSKSRDPLNSETITAIRGGTPVGKITSGGKYAPAIIGVTDVAYASGTSLSLTTVSGNELERRLGSSGTFKLTGPPTASGTVRTITVTYSAIAAAGSGHRVVTVTAIQVPDVWTLTAPAGQDAGMYQIEVTTGKGTSAEVVAVTAALAANANTATVDAAVEALANVGTGNVAAVYSDPTLTLTFAATLGPVHVRVLADTTNDGGVFEGGWAAVHTTTGVDGRFVTNSLIQPVDGSETVKGLLNNPWQLNVVDENNDSQDVQLTHLLLGGHVEPVRIPDYTNWDASLKTWLKTNLKAAGPFTFTDDAA